MGYNAYAFITGYGKRVKVLNTRQAAGMTRLLGFLDGPSTTVHRQRDAYLLATVKHECADTWEPIPERGTPPYFIKRYWTNEKVRRQLGNLQEQDAVRYRGRGYVQITGRRNYALFGKLLNLPLLDSPELAEQPAVSFAIAQRGMRDGLFTGKKITEYINESQCDYVNARRVINGRDKAEIIAAYAVIMYGLLVESGT